MSVLYYATLYTVCVIMGYSMSDDNIVWLQSKSFGGGTIHQIFNLDETNKHLASGVRGDGKNGQFPVDHAL